MGKKMKNKFFHIRIQEEFLAVIKEWARKDLRTLSGFVLKAISDRIKKLDMEK
jgi:hypothetical protein